MTEGDAIFKEFGFEGKSIEYVERQIKIKRTILRLLLTEFENKSQEEAKTNFYKLKAAYTKTIGDIPINIALVEWLGVIEAIKEINKTTPKNNQ